MCVTHWKLSCLCVVLLLASFVTHASFVDNWFTAAALHTYQNFKNLSLVYKETSAILVLKCSCVSAGPISTVPCQAGDASPDPKRWSGCPHHLSDLLLFFHRLCWVSSSVCNSPLLHCLCSLCVFVIFLSQFVIFFMSQYLSFSFSLNFLVIFLFSQFFPFAQQLLGSSWFSVRSLHKNKDYKTNTKRIQNIRL